MNSISNMPIQAEFLLCQVTDDINLNFSKSQTTFLNIVFTFDKMLKSYKFRRRVWRLLELITSGTSIRSFC